MGRDKLDVVKGVRFSPLLRHFLKLKVFGLQSRAFEKLLQDYPDWAGKVIIIQVTSPALTDSPKLERMASEIVAQINGEYESLDLVPVYH